LQTKEKIGRNVVKKKNKGRGEKIANLARKANTNVFAHAPQHKQKK